MSWRGLKVQGLSWRRPLSSRETWSSGVPERWADSHPPSPQCQAPRQAEVKDPGTARGLGWGGWVPGRVCGIGPTSVLCLLRLPPVSVRASGLLDTSPNLAGLHFAVFLILHNHCFLQCFCSLLTKLIHCPSSRKDSKIHLLHNSDPSQHHGRLG